VDDPRLFGRIAAANALSDVYAMGGKPLCAMNIVCFPAKTMDLEVLRQVLKGGLETLHEAEALLVGGHSIQDAELKYGLSVTGLVHPQRIWTNRGAQVGDRLVLTTPLGTGIVSTAAKGGEAGAEAIEAISQSMCTLNRRAAEIAAQGTVHACTDVTGFGLIGHACEMIGEDPIGFALWTDRIPVFTGTVEYCRAGLLPGGLYRNRDFRQASVTVEHCAPGCPAEVLYDPQTSGGLLFAVPGGEAEALVEKLCQGGVAEAAVIGEVLAEPQGRIVLRVR
jgi:selenide,water dikinase